MKTFEEYTAFCFAINEKLDRVLPAKTDDSDGDLDDDFPDTDLDDLAAP